MDTQQPTYTAPFTPLGTAPVTSGADGNSTPSAEEGYYSNPGWSWGGFMQWSIFAIGLRKYWYLLFILAGMVPIIGGLISIGVMIFFGIKGREMAAASSVFANRQQYIGFMKGIDHAGKVMFWIGLIFMVAAVAVAGVVSSLVFGGIGESRDRAREASAFQTGHSLVPVMVLCRDAGGSVDVLGANAGDAICNAAQMEEMVYPDLPDGWRYGAVHDVGDDGFEFTISSYDTSRPMFSGLTIVCTQEGCDKED